MYATGSCRGILAALDGSFPTNMQVGESLCRVLPRGYFAMFYNRCAAGHGGGRGCHTGDPGHSIRAPLHTDVSTPGGGIYIEAYVVIVHGGAYSYGVAYWIFP